GGLRKAFAPLAGRDDRGRAGGGRSLQERRDGFRAVETLGSVTARLGIALGTRPPRLAYRMLGHGRKISGRNLRYSWRWRRYDVSPSRKRDRPKRKRPPRSPPGQGLDAQWLSAGGRGEDVQIAGQFLHHPRSFERLAGRGAALQHAAHALSPAH